MNKPLDGLKRPTSFQRPKQVARKVFRLKRFFFIGEQSMLVSNNELLNTCRVFLGNHNAKHS